jgi:hypothetical protein
VATVVVGTMSVDAISVNNCNKATSVNVPAIAWLSRFSTSAIIWSTNDIWMGFNMGLVVWRANAWMRAENPSTIARLSARAELTRASSARLRLRGSADAVANGWRIENKCHFEFSFVTTKNLNLTASRQRSNYQKYLKQDTHFHLDTVSLEVEVYLNCTARN